MSKQSGFGVLFANVVVVDVVVREASRFKIGGMVLGPCLSVGGLAASSCIGGVWVVSMRGVVVGLTVLYKGLTDISIVAVIATKFHMVIGLSSPVFPLPLLGFLLGGMVMTLWSGCGGVLLTRLSVIALSTCLVPLKVARLYATA